jgi:hypothetical protein
MSHVQKLRAEMRQQNPHPPARVTDPNEAELWCCAISRLTQTMNCADGLQLGGGGVINHPPTLPRYPVLTVILRRNTSKHDLVLSILCDMSADSRC